MQRMNVEQSSCGRVMFTGLLLVSLGCQRTANPATPQVQGKTLQEWFELAAAPVEPDSSVDIHHRELRARNDRTEALENIRAFDAAAIPVLMDLSQLGDRALRTDANRILAQIGKQISPEAESVIPLLASLREHAASAMVNQWTNAVLIDISTGATPVSAMMKPLSDRKLRSAVVVELAKSDWWINEMSVSTKPIDALQGIGSRSGPRSSPDVDYEDAAELSEQVSRTRMYVIDNFETKRLPPVSELVDQAKVPQTTMMALQGLQHHAQAGAAVPGIDLGSLTPDLSGAVDVLIPIVETGHFGKATRAIKILGLIGPEASSAVPHALKMLESDFYDSRAEAAAALGGFGVKDREVVEALVASLENEKAADDDFVRRLHSRTQQGRGTGQGRGMRSQLAEGTLRANVAVALGKLAAHPDLSIPALIKMLDMHYMGSSDGCDLAAESLAAFGDDAQTAIPELVDNLQSRPLTQPALATLHRIDPGLVKTIPVLVARLDSDKDDVRLHNMLVLALLRRESKPAIGRLEKIARSEDAKMSAWAAYAIWKIDPESHSLVPALPVLIDALKDPNTRYLNKFELLTDLASIGAEAKPAVPAIVIAINRGDFGKQWGTDYLRKIDPSASAE